MDRPGSLPKAVAPIPAMTQEPRRVIRPPPRLGQHPLPMRVLLPGAGGPTGYARHDVLVRAQATAGPAYAARHVLEAERAGGQHHLAELRVLDLQQRAAEVELRVPLNLGQFPHRRAGDPGLGKPLEQRLLRHAADPAGDDPVHFLHPGDAVRTCGVVRVAGQRLVPEESGQRLPVAVVVAKDGDMAVRRRIDVVGADGEAAMPVAGALDAGRPLGGEEAEVGGQGGIDGLQHGDLHRARAARPFALEQGGDDGAVEVHARAEVDHRRPRLQGRPVGLAGDGHDAAHGLHREVHRGVVAIGTVRAVAGAAGDDQARIDGAQRVPRQAEPVHDAGPVVLHQHVGIARQAQQRLPVFPCLQVQHDAALAGVEHGEGHARAGLARALAQLLALRRLHLHHVRAGHGQQEGGVGAVVDLGEVEDADAVQRARCHHRPPKRGGRFSLKAARPSCTSSEA